MCVLSLSLYLIYDLRPTREREREREKERERERKREKERKRERKRERENQKNIKFQSLFGHGDKK